MGASWVAVRDAVRQGTLRPTDRGLNDVISRWEQLLRFTALRLGRELGADVDVILSRKEAADPTVRLANQTAALTSAGVLSGSLRIPGSIAPLHVAADVRLGRVAASVDVDAPREGRPLTRVNWLLRQLRDAPAGIRVDASFVGGRGTTSELLESLRERPEALLDGQREPKSFRLTQSASLGMKRASGRGGFIDSVLTAIDDFYGAVVQQLRPWARRAPQFPKGGRTAAEEAGLELSAPPQDLAGPVKAKRPTAVDAGTVTDTPAEERPDSACA